MNDWAARAEPTDSIDAQVRTARAREAEGERLTSISKIMKQLWEPDAICKTLFGYHWHRHVAVSKVFVDVHGNPIEMVPDWTVCPAR